MIFHDWFRWWLCADQAISHYLNQWWIVYWRIYASIRLDGLNETQGEEKIVNKGQSRKSFMFAWSQPGTEITKSIWRDWTSLRELVIKDSGNKISSSGQTPVSRKKAYKPKRILFPIRWVQSHFAFDVSLLNLSCISGKVYYHYHDHLHCKVLEVKGCRIHISLRSNHHATSCITRHFLGVALSCYLLSTKIIIQDFIILLGISSPSRHFYQSFGRRTVLNRKGNRGLPWQWRYCLGKCSTYCAA